MAENTGTQYVVLKQSKDAAGAPSWEVLSESFPGRSAGSVIRDYLTTKGDGKGGVFVAVPARSWNPVTVTVETKTVLKLGGS